MRKTYFFYNMKHKKTVFIVLAVICLVAAGGCRKLYNPGDENKIFTATFEVTNNLGQDIVYRHTYHSFMREYHYVTGPFTIECFIGSGETEEVGLSYWKYLRFDATDPKYVFEQIYIGDVKEDSKIEIISASSGAVLATWTPRGKASKKNLYHYKKWSCTKEQYEDDTNIYTVFKWSSTLNKTDLQ